MENITEVTAASDEQLVAAADTAAVDYDTAAPSIVLGEPCDV